MLSEENENNISISSMKLKFDLPEKPVSKHKHEYQEVCSELEKTYGKLVWTLPFKKGFTEYKLKKAHEVCLKRGILTFKYLYGVLRKL